MKIDRKLIGHAFESAILIVSSIVLYDFVKILYKLLRKKVPNFNKFHQFTLLLGNVITIFIIDIVLIIILDEFFNTNII
jgi:hypothetical protein